MKKILLILLLIFIGIQFIPMDVPADVYSSSEEELNAPEDIKGILKHSCFDCHSNHTKFPWYSNIAPASWFIKNHVKEGREKMNFSIWESYDDAKKLKYLEKIPEAIQGKMPLPSYLIMHTDNALSEPEAIGLKNWATETTSIILYIEQ